MVDRSNHKIRKVTPQGVVTTLAGTGVAGAQDGPGASATFRYPDGAVVDSQGNIYITDQSNHKIRKIDINGIVSTFAGTGTAGFRTARLRRQNSSIPQEWLSMLMTTFI